jgi:hypothetical protein
MLFSLVCRIAAFRATQHHAHTISAVVYGDTLFERLEQHNRTTLKQ